MPACRVSALTVLRAIARTSRCWCVRRCPRSRSPTAVGLLPVRIDLAEPVTFTHGDRAVLAWRVAPTEELRDLHRAVHAAAGEGEDAPHTTPGAWTPHITLARRLRLASLPEALDLIGPPLTGTGVALRRWDSASSTVTPVRSVCD